MGYVLDDFQLGFFHLHWRLGLAFLFVFLDFLDNLILFFHRRFRGGLFFLPFFLLLILAAFYFEELVGRLDLKLFHLAVSLVVFFRLVDGILVGALAA